MRGVGLAPLASQLMLKSPSCVCQDWITSRIEYLDNVVSVDPSCVCDCSSHIPYALTVLTRATTSVGPQMASFQERVLRLQEVVCTCEEVQVIMNVVVLEGLHVAETGGKGGHTQWVH
jgi:hypothetical protein